MLRLNALKIVGSMFSTKLGTMSVKLCFKFVVVFDSAMLALLCCDN